MIKIDGKNSLEDLFFKKSNPFADLKLIDDFHKKTKFKKFNLFFNLGIVSDFVNFPFEIIEGKKSYKIELYSVKNEFIDNKFKCPKEILEIMNQPKVLDYFTHKKAMLQDLLLSQKNDINLVKTTLKYSGFSNEPFIIEKKLNIISRDSTPFEKGKNVYELSIMNQEIYSKIGFDNLSEKELKYVLNNFSNKDKRDIYIRITNMYKGSVNDFFESTTLSEVKKDILEMVDKHSDQKKSLQKELK